MYNDINTYFFEKLRISQVNKKFCSQFLYKQNKIFEVIFEAL